jgi:hypothetical protein
LSIDGPGFSSEYGDSFDIMGIGERTYSSWEKIKLGWMPTNCVLELTNSGIVTLHNHDVSALQPAATYALRIPAGDKTFWVDCQSPTSQIQQLADAIVVRWEPETEDDPATSLLDMTPETIDNPLDAALIVGRTFSDRKRRIQITALERTADSFSVEVKFGDFSDNHPPVISTSFQDVVQINVGATLNVSANANDLDGDPISITWNFGDSRYAIGGDATHVFLYEGEYSVRCEASDRKGGVTMKSFVAQVGSPSANRVSGIVTRSGVPLPNACIYVQGTYVSARTGADGRYVLPGLSPGSQTLKGAYDGVELRGKGFANPYVANGVQGGVDWEFPEIRAFDMNIQVAEDSNSTPLTLAGESPTGSVIYELIDAPIHGLLRGTLPAITYTPDPNFAGADSFTYRVRAEAEQSLPAQVSITVTPQADPPIVFGKTGGRAEATSTLHWTPGLDETLFIFNACVGRDGRLYAVALKSGVTGNDIVVRCVGTHGNVAWDRTLDFGKYDIPKAVLAHGDGIIVNTMAGADSWIVRLSDANELVWTYFLTNGTCYAAEGRGEDALIIAGTQDSPFVAKIDGATGRELWRKAAPATLSVNYIDIADDGSFVVTGSLDMGGGGLGGSGNGRDVATLKFSEDGDLLWSRTFGTDNIEFGIQSYAAGDGSIYTWAGSNGFSYSSVVHYGPDGELLWQSDPINGVSALVFDGHDIPILLASDSLLRFSSRAPDRLWTATNVPVSMRLNRDGFFEILSSYPVEGETAFWLTTLDSTGNELSSVPLRHSVTFMQWTKALSDPNSNAFYLIDGAPWNFGGAPRITRFVNEALPLHTIFPSDASTVLGPIGIGLDDGDLMGEIIAPPAHGTMSGEWPNWVFTAASSFSGADKIGFRIFQPDGEPVSGELKFFVNPRPKLYLSKSADDQSFTAAILPTSSGLEWSKDLKSWARIRGQNGTTDLNFVRFRSPRFFRATQ